MHPRIVPCPASDMPDPELELAELSLSTLPRPAAMPAEMFEFAVQRVTTLFGPALIPCSASRRR